MKKGKLTSKIFAIALVLVMIGSILGGLHALVSKVEASPGTIYVPDNYPTIQTAVDAASPGDTIIVRDGTYFESIVIDRDHLTIRSENGANHTMGGVSFYVTADYVSIGGFTVIGGHQPNSERGWPGIRLEASYCNISGNIITYSDPGIDLGRYTSNNIITDNNISGNIFDGIGSYMGPLSHDNIITNNIITSNGGQGIYNSRCNTITNNTVSNNYRGIIVGSDNTLVNNNVSNNGYAGIDLWGGNNTLKDNIISGSAFNFGLELEPFDYPAAYVQDIDTSNTVNGKPICYWVDQRDRQVPEDAGFVAVVNSTNITVEGLTLTNNFEGVLFVNTNNSRIEDVKVASNARGIVLLNSSNNTLANNAISNNGGCYYMGGLSYGNGILLSYSNGNTLTNNIVSNNEGSYYPWVGMYGGGININYSSSNIIYRNNFINNNKQYDNLYPDNVWNSPEEITYTYSGNTYTNYLGNYWSDYIGSDADGDGIGETPYPVYSDADNYPLVEPFENYVIGEDTTPPTVSSVSPGDGATDVATDTVITATFSEAMDETTIDETSFTLAGSEVSGTVEYDSATYTATFTPDANLDYNHTYTATLSTAITDLTGNPLTEPYSWSFTTQSPGNNPPTAYIDSVSPNPADQGQAVSFSGHGTDPDPGDSITAYNWRSSIDGQLSTSSSFTKSNLSVGTHIIYFKVQDSHGTWSTEATEALTINPSPTPNQPPNPGFVYSPVEPKVGQWVTFDASSSKDPDGEIVLYEWDWNNNGIIDDRLAEPQITYYWDTSGTEQVSLIVTDNRGARSEKTMDVLIEEDSFWERFKGFFKEEHKITDEELKLIKSERGLNIYNYPYPYPEKNYFDPMSDMRANPGSNIDLYVYLDYELKRALDKEIGEEVPDLTYGMYILNAINEVEMVESVWTQECNIQAGAFFNAMLDINTGWSSVPIGMAEGLFSGLLNQPYSAGASTLFLSYKIAKAGIFIGKLKQTLFYNSLWWYLREERAQGSTHEEAWQSIQREGGWASEDCRIPAKGLLESEAEYEEKLNELAAYYDRLWNVYGDALKKNELNVFKRELKNRLREILYSVLQRHKSELLEWEVIGAKSPIELRIYDSQGNLTGVMDGEAREGIPYSVYGDRIDTVVIFYASDSYRYEVVGTEEGSYGLEVTSIKGGETTSFIATDIPTMSGAVHQYTIDWDALSEGEEGVTVQTDSDGDGEFEETVVTSQPNTPSNPAPTNNATAVSVDADLSWSGGDPDTGENVTYSIYFGTNSTPPLVETIGPYSANQTSLNYDLNTLGYNTTYYWQVVARDNHGITREGALWDFTTQPNNSSNIPIYQGMTIVQVYPGVDIDLPANLPDEAVMVWHQVTADEATPEIPAGTWLHWIRGAPPQFNSLHRLVTGKAYLISATVDCVWPVPAA